MDQWSLSHFHQVLPASRPLGDSQCAGSVAGHQEPMSLASRGVITFVAADGRGAEAKDG